MSGPQDLWCARGCRQHRAGQGEAPGGCREGPGAPAPGDPSLPCPTRSPPSGRTLPSWRRASSPGLVPGSHPQQPVSTCLASPGCRGPPPNCLGLAHTWHPCAGAAGPVAGGDTDLQATPRGPAPTCPAPPGLISTASSLPIPAQPAQASAARNHRENACLCQLCRKQNSLWFVTQIFCLFFQNITKLKTAPPTPTPQADRNDLFTLALAPGPALHSRRPRRRGAGPGRGESGRLGSGGCLLWGVGDWAPAGRWGSPRPRLAGVGVPQSTEGPEETWPPAAVLRGRPSAPTPSHRPLG